MKLSKAEIIAKMRAGETVIFKGRVIRSIEDVPSNVEIAGDDIVARQAAVKDLEAEAKRIQAELEAAKKEAEVKPPAPELKDNEAPVVAPVKGKK